MTVQHEPPGYECPFCVLASGGDTPLSGQADIVRRTPGAFAFVSPRWKAANPGHVLVVSRDHHENLYDLPATAGYAVHDLTREIAVALRAVYGCDGISTRQHNEPAGDQTVWHYHVHVSPRYHGDDMYRSPVLPDATAEERQPYAQRLRAYFAQLT